MNRKMFILVFVLITFVGSVCNVNAKNGAATGMGPLSGTLENGQDGAWTLYVNETGVEFVNESGSGAVTYRWVRPDRSERKRSFSVYIAAQHQEEIAGSGMMYAYNPEAATYYAFMIRGKQVALVERTRQGFETRLSSTIEGLDPKALTKLEIRESGNEAKFLINNKVVATLANSAMSTGAVGVLAMGIGQHWFQGFSAPYKDRGRQAEGTTETRPPVRESNPTAAPGSANNERSNRALAARPVRSAPGTLRLLRARIFDRQGFARPVIYRTFLAPTDWRVEGEVRWNQGINYCLGEGRRTVFRVASPDGRAVFEMLPDYIWTWSEDPMQQQAAQMGGCPLKPPLDAAGVLSQVVRPGAMARRNPELAQLTMQEFRQSPYFKILQQQGVRLSADAAQAQISNAQIDERVSATLMIAQTMYPNLSSGAMVPSTTFGAYNIYSMRTPKGAFDHYAPIFTAILGSMRQNPLWDALVNAHDMQMARITQRGQIDRNQIWREAQEYVGDVQMKTWEYSQQSLSKVATWQSRRIRDVDAYIDPSSHTVFDLPSGFVRAFVNGLDEVVLTTDPGLNAADLGNDWRQLDQTNAVPGD